MTRTSKIAIACFALIALLAVPTFVFPLVCGVSRLGFAPSAPAPPWWWTNTAQNPIRSTLAWLHYAKTDGWTGYAYLFWSQTGLWWRGFDVTHALAPRLAASVFAGVTVAFGLIVAAIRSAQPKTRTERHHERGSKLVEREDAARFVRSLVVREIETAHGKLAAIVSSIGLRLRGPSGRHIRAVRKDAKVQPRQISRATARGDAAVMKIAAAGVDAGLVRMAGIPMPYSSETLHTLIAASPGTGKTVALRELLTDLRRRGDRVICVDAGYDLSPGFRDPDDLILSPVDPQSVGWSLRNEVRNETEWGSLIKSMIPAQNGPAGTWQRKAQDFMTSLCEAVGSAADNRKLLEIATVWSTEQLLDLLEGTPAAIALGEGGEEYLNSVRNNINESLSAWKRGPDGDFSVRRYMNAIDERRWLWLPYTDLEAASCQPAIASWIDIMINAATERRDAGGKPGGHRTWIIIDELNSMGLIPNLSKLGARLRKYDICGVGIIQDEAQLKSTYGVYDADTIFSTFSNKVYFRCSSAGLARRISDDLGMTEYREVRYATSRSRSAGKVTQSTSTSEQHVKRELFLPSEIQNLPTRCGVVKFAEVDSVLPTYLWVPPRPRR